MKKSLITIEAMHSLRVGELTEMEQRMQQLQMDPSLTKPKKTRKAKAKASDDDEEDPFDRPEFYTVINGTAVIPVNGPLLSQSSWISRYLGYMSYQDIREAVMMAGSDPNVQDILMMYGSPGGTVGGISDAADVIKKIDNGVKPVFSYCNRNMCSAAYWLGSTSREIFISPEAELGSIGVIVTHFSYEKALESEGIKVEIIRSSEMKAIGGPYKDLTEKEINHIQRQVGQMNDLFQGHVQAQRPRLKISALTGETFIGAEAVTVGLADGVMSYDAVIQYIQNKRATTTPIGGYGMKFTAVELRAALEAGKTLEDLELSQAEADEILAAVPATEEQMLTEPEAIVEPVAKDEGPDLAAQLVALGGELSAKGAKIAQLEADISQFEAQMASLKKIACDVTKSRRIALGYQGSVDLDAMTISSVLAEYDAVTAQFDKAFVAGGIFKNKNITSTEEPKAPVAEDSVRDGQLRSASI
jgi:signal peptide peptidase SppA